MESGAQISNASATPTSDPDYVVLYQRYDIANFIPTYVTYYKFLFNIRASTDAVLLFQCYNNSQLVTSESVYVSAGTFLIPVIFKFTAPVDVYSNSVEARVKTSSGTVSITQGFYYNFEIQQVSPNA
jgi:hypothetical protein